MTERYAGQMISNINLMNGEGKAQSDISQDQEHVTHSNVRQLFIVLLHLLGCETEHKHEYAEGIYDL